MRFPRKAAFFTLIAAEAMAKCPDCPDAPERASSLYLAASHLYSRRANALESGAGDSEVDATRYGWASLRAAALQGLSMQSSDKEVAEAGEAILDLYGSIDASCSQHFGSFPCSI